jgi:hypothetical protein
MSKVGRNDPCPCGSGEKYKNCCLHKKQQKQAVLGGRKFTAKVLSGGEASKSQAQAQSEAAQLEQKAAQEKAMADYANLMERSFGESLRQHEDQPPIPSKPLEYMVKDDKEGQKPLDSQT